MRVFGLRQTFCHMSIGLRKGTFDVIVDGYCRRIALRSRYLMCHVYYFGLDGLYGCYGEGSAR